MQSGSEYRRRLDQIPKMYSSIDMQTYRLSRTDRLRIYLSECMVCFCIVFFVICVGLLLYLFVHLYSSLSTNGKFASGLAESWARQTYIDPRLPAYHQNNLRQLQSNCDWSSYGDSDWCYISVQFCYTFYLKFVWKCLNSSPNSECILEQLRK